MILSIQAITLCGAVKFMIKDLDNIECRLVYLSIFLLMPCYRWYIQLSNIKLENSNRDKSLGKRTFSTPSIFFIHANGQFHGSTVLQQKNQFVTPFTVALL